ncbi:MAG: hypothetical protein ACYTBS_20575 [Planctomycetota bacterium]|jgi:hypothetical protein
MKFLDSLMGKTNEAGWNPSHRAILRDLSYDEIVSVLGRPKKAKGGYVYWRGEVETLDPDYPEGVYYQISNKDFRGFGDAAKKPKIDREKWFLIVSDGVAIRLITYEVGGLARNIEEV